MTFQQSYQKTARGSVDLSAFQQQPSYNDFLMIEEQQQPETRTEHLYRLRMACQQNGEATDLYQEMTAIYNSYSEQPRDPRLKLELQLCTAALEKAPLKRKLTSIERKFDVSKAQQESMKKQLDVLTEGSAPEDPTTLRVTLDWVKATLVLAVYLILFYGYLALHELINLNSQLSNASAAEKSSLQTNIEAQADTLYACLIAAPLVSFVWAILALAIVRYKNRIDRQDPAQVAPQAQVAGQVPMGD